MIEKNLSQSSTNIVIINVPNYGTISGVRYQPLGIGYISARASQRGYSCDIIDANCSTIPMTIEELTTKVANKYTIIGLYSTSFSFFTAVEIAEKIKKFDKSKIIILGGHHATPLHKEIIDEYSCFDFIIRGEGEDIFSDLLDSIHKDIPISSVKGITYRSDGVTMVNQDSTLQCDLDIYPFPERWKLPTIDDYSGYYDNISCEWKKTATIITSRGCVGNCSYCVDQDVFLPSYQKRWRTRSIKNVQAELQLIMQDYNPKHILFFDACFLADIDRAIKILKILHELDSSVTCSFTARADQICKYADSLPELKKLGCASIEIGIESGSESCLKRFNKGVTVETNRRALNLLHNSGISCLVDFIMFEPYMNMDDIRLNLEFLKEQGLYGYFPCLLYNRIILYPGSKIRREMEAQGLTFGSKHSLQYFHCDKKVQMCWDGLLKYMDCSSNLSDLLTNAKSRVDCCDRDKNEKLVRRLKALIQYARIFPYIYFEKLFQCVASGIKFETSTVANEVLNIEQEIRKLITRIDTESTGGQYVSNYKE